MSDLVNNVQEIISSGKSMGISMIAHSLRAKEKDVIDVLNADQGLVVDGSNFDKVWSFMTTLDKMTFITLAYGNVIEVTTNVIQGKDAMGYFNLMGDAALGGHIKKDLVTHIALISIPFMKLESYQIAFLNSDGTIMYSFYLGRDNHKLRENEVLAFKNLKEELRG